MLVFFPVSNSNKNGPISIAPNDKLLFMARTCIKYYIGNTFDLSLTNKKKHRRHISNHSKGLNNFKKKPFPV